jgi:hypothetical protein
MKFKKSSTETAPMEEKKETKRVNNYLFIKEHDKISVYETRIDVDGQKYLEKLSDFLKDWVSCSYSSNLSSHPSVFRILDSIVFGEK